MSRPGRYHNPQETAHLPRTRPRLEAARAMIAEPLRPLARPVADFTLLPGNPRQGDVEAVKRSLERFGQRKPIVVRDDGTIEAGNTTLLAALELGWTEIAAVAFGDDEATAKAFALADNRTSELGTFDLAALAVMAGDVHAADPDLLEAASYTEADLMRWLGDEFEPEDDSPRLDELEPRLCPKCGYDVANDPEALKP